MIQKKSGKRGYIITGFVVLILLAAFIIYKKKKSAFLDHQLQEMVQNKTNQLYKLSYDSITVNEAAGNVHIKNLRLTGDTGLQSHMLTNGDTNAVNMLMDVYVPSLEVNNFKTAGALLSSKLVCRQVLLSNPVVTIYLFPGQHKAVNPYKQREELYKQILGNLKLIKADSITIVKSEVIVKDFYSGETKFHTYNTSLNLSDVAIDSTYSYDTSRTLFCKQINITAEKVIAGANNNTAKISNAFFDTRSQVLSLSSFEYDAFKNKGFFKSRLEGIELKGINWSGPVENSDLSIAEAVFNKAELETASTKGGGRKNNDTKPKQILTGWLKSFSLASLQLKALDYTSRPMDKQAKALVIKNSMVYLKDVRIDRTTLLDESLISKAKEIDISNNDITLASNDKFYKYRFAGLKVNTLSKQIIVKAVQVIPLLNEDEFSRKAYYQKDRYDVKINNLVCSNVNMEKLVQGEIAIEDIATSNNSILVFRDLSYKIDSATKEKNHDTYPVQLLNNLKFPVKVNRFTAGNTLIEYKEKNAKSHSSGKVRFTNSNIVFNNISNHTAAQGEKNTINFSASFLEKVPVTATIVFYANEWRKGKFSVDISTHKSFDAKLLSQLTRPMSLASIDQGTINTFHFHILADSLVSNGTLELTYDDLKISLLKKKGDEYNKKGVVSLLANLLVKNKNESGPGMRIGKIENKRDFYRSFFNFIWKSAFAGAKQVLLLKI